MEKLWIATMAVVAGVALSPVQAADLPQKAPVGEAPAASLWSGCYIGLAGGGVWGTSQHISAATNTVAITPKFAEAGGIAGGTLGCNYDIHSWILGAENDFSWTNARGSTSDQPPFNVAAISHTDQTWFDSVRARAGLAWVPSLMTYVTAGAAFAGTRATICVAPLCASESQVRTGWIAGIGAEYAFWNNLSVKFEYLHADFASARYFSTPTSLGTGTIVTRDVELKDDLVRVGMNWRFMPRP